MEAPFRVLVSDPIHEDGRRRLAAQPGVGVDVQTSLDEAGLIEIIGNYDALVVRSKTKVTEKVLAAADKLKAVGRAGIGVDNIDIPAATARGIVIFNTPDANATTTAELTLAHLMSLSRHLPQADSAVRRGEWKPSNYMGTELAGKTIGVIGFGTIGRLVAVRCAGLKMKVLAYDPFVTEDVLKQSSADPATLENLLEQSDYVTLHCPLTDKTRNIINRDRIAMMKPGSRLLNCARGGLVDEAALIDGLNSGHLAGAALDVYAQEPPKNSPLLELQSVVLTPHLGASTAEAQQAVSVKIADVIADFLAHGTAETAVNLPRISSEQYGMSRPYQGLAHSLGQIISALTQEPIKELVVRLFGRVAELDSRPITTEALVGVLSMGSPERINRVNAAHLAREHGIEVRESRTEDVRDYLSLVEVSAITESGSVTVAGTLLGGQLPRLVRIDGYRLEAIPEGRILLTRHHDRPGVVGDLGAILGRESINISRMSVGVDDTHDTAIALIGISAPLSDKALHDIQALDAIVQAVELAL